MGLFYDLLINANTTLNATDTDTTGKYTYVVALRLGGMTGEPDVRHEDYQLIRADSEKEAVEKYNELNKCTYYYGEVINRV